jgi:hypothetical protein
MNDRDWPRPSGDPRLAHPSTAYSGITSYALTRYDALRGTSLQSPVHGFDSHRRLEFRGSGYGREFASLSARWSVCDQIAASAHVSGPVGKVDIRNWKIRSPLRRSGVR